MRPVPFILGAHAGFCVALLQAAAPPPAVIGYVFPQNRVLEPAEVMAEKLTHINYAFANIRNGEMVEGFEHDTENFVILNALKARNPKLKILVSVGGWTWSGDFSDVALTPKSRGRFIESAVAFLKHHGLDGLDVDWEYPGQKGLNNINRPEDKENSTALLAELRAALDQAGRQSGRRYLLTMATQAADVWLEHTEMDKAQSYLDFVNLMTYDHYGEWDPITGHHAPLFTNPADPKANSAATTVDHYIAAGVPPGKLVLGVPFYGHSWADVPPAEHGLYQPGKKPAQRINASFKNIRDNLENKDGFVRYWDDVAKAPFLYSADKRTFISYEDEESIRAKVRFVADRGLAGIMFWQHSQDPDGTLQTAILEGLKRPQAKKRLLVIGEEKGYRHESVSHAMTIIEKLGRESGEWDTTIRTDTEVLTKKKLEYNAPNLNVFDAVVFYTGGSLEMDPSQKADLLSFVHDDGKGFIGIHSAAITFTDWPEFGELLGGYYDEHPWGTFDAPIIVEDPGFPGMDAWRSTFVLRDEIYQMRNYSRDRVRVLLRLDASKLDLTKKGVHRKDDDFAVAWAKMYGKGRVFYSTLGHPVEVWDRPDLQKMYAEAIRWVLGLRSADVSPRSLTGNP